LSVEYGGRHWLSGDYEDLNRAMIAEGEPIIPSLLDTARRKQEAADIDTATALLAKHGISAEGIVISSGADRSTAEAPKAQQELLRYG
jgi:hypothetical protein